MSGGRVNFTDSDHTNIEFPSAWRVAAKSASIECQTTPELYQFEEAEMQTGPSTSVMQSEVSSKFAGKTLLQFLAKTKKQATAEEWEERIENGTITVDMEVVTDPSFALGEDYFIEYVDYRKDAGVQTEPPEGEESKQASEGDPALLSFLRRAEGLVSEQLVQNASSRAFDGYHVSAHFSSAKIQLWSSLSVDLEQRKVIFPDWSRGDHFKGTVAHCSLTRNKERVYDIEYRDTGVYDRINGVRGEYIRVFDDSNVRTVATAYGSRATAVLKEGIRVHVKMAEDKKSRGEAKYYPGRVAAVHRSGTIDVECNERMLNGLTPSDVILGLEAGYSVEARQPTHVQLQCTGVSWTCSGGAVAVSYGRNDITGWCDFPGAVCVWSIFDKTFQPTEPQHVFDHPSCIMCVSFHPQSPSIVAGGSFNGEVVVWNLNAPEKAMCMTAIDSPYSHKEPVLDLKWIYDNAKKKHLLTSVGADGKLLFWDIDNGLTLPVRGVVTSNSKEKRNHYPRSHGGTSVAFTATPASHRFEWVLIGQEGGGISRGQMSRISNLPQITETQPSSDDIYPAMRRSEDSFNYEAHVGPVQAIEGSPFHRYLFLTGGNDGTVRLYHVLERRPLFEWEPSPPPGTTGLSGKLFGAVTAVKFSPVSPAVFATSSSEGFVFFFNLAVSTTGPISWVQIPAPAAPSGKRRGGSSVRPGVTGIAFNSRQRDMFAASDSNGGVHVWKLDWSLANAGTADQSVLDRLGSVAVDKNGEMNA